MKTTAILLSDAISLASGKHKGQFDKGGSPYILHCLRVMNNVQVRFPSDYELASIAVMHDIVEDTDITVEHLREHFNSTIASAVSCLTKTDEEKDDPNLYLDKILSNHFSSIVKLFDLKDNMDPMRLKGLRQKDFDRMVKYQNMFYTIHNTLKQRGTIL